MTRFAFLRVLLTALVLLVVIVPFTFSFTPRALAGAPPCTTRSDNLTRNGSVTEGGYDTAHGTVINSWNAFLVSGDWPQYDLADNESANGDVGGSSSQYIHGDGVDFDAGIYQVIAGVQPGASYEFLIGWAEPLRDVGGGNNQKNDNWIGRRVGADPMGGTDPNSPTVIWGPEVWNGGRGLNNPDMDLTFKALANQVTVFARVFNRGTAPSNKIFFDVLCLLPRGDIPVENIAPSPTATSPATEPPPTSAETNTPRPTRVPPTDAATPTPPATPLPAQVFTTTPLSVASARATTPPQLHPNIPGFGGADDSNSGGSGGNTIPLAAIIGAIGIIGISLLGIILIGGFAVWRIFFRQVEDALDPNYYPDDQSHYQ